MADQLQLRGGSTAEHSTFTGALREVTVDIDKDTVVVHDNATAGGHPLLREDLSNLPAGTIDNADINANAEIAVSKLADGAARQLLQTDSAGTGVEWTNNVDVPGTLDVTGAATLDSTLDVTGLISADGKVSFPLGTAALPSLYPGTDTNTGIYSPGADQVAVATNGQGRLFIDASGRIGIAGSPSASSNTYLQVGYAGIGSDHVLYNYDSYFANNLYKSGNLAWSRISARAGGLLRIDDDTFTYSTANSGTAGASATLSERLRITSAGLVGIGTSSPRAKVDFGPGSGYGALDQTLSNYQAVFEAPQVTGNISRNIAFAVTTGGICAAINATDEGGAGATGLMVATGSAGSIAERLRIDNLGNVGIGTTNPSGNLTVNLSSTDKNISFSGVQSEVNNVPALVAHNNAGSLKEMGFRGVDLRFACGSSERARIDSSGRLLVGTSTARRIAGGQSLVQVEANDSTGRLSVVQNRNEAFAGPVISLGKSRGTSLNSNTVVQSGDLLGTLAFAGADGTDLDTFAASIAAEVDGTPGANDMPGRLVFSTTADGASSPSERMRLDSGGRWKAFTASAAHQLKTALAANASDELLLGVRSTTTMSDGTTVFVVRTNGDVDNTNNSYGAISDLKLKENIVDATSQWDDLKAIQVRKYNFKEETGHEIHTQLGVIAQEIELVSPGLVKESPDKDPEGNDLGTVTKSVNYSVLYMKAVKALQEAMERIETLEQRLSDAGIA